MRLIEVRALKDELVRRDIRRDMSLQKLANRLDVPVSTLSSWIHRVHKPPVDLAARIEQLLELPTGFVSAADERQPRKAES